MSRTAAFSGDVTSSEPDDESDDADGDGYVDSTAGLIDKHVFGRRPLRRVMAVVAVAVVAYVFIEDNRASAMQLFSWGQLAWTLIKGMAIAATIAFIYFMYSLFDRSDLTRR